METRNNTSPLERIKSSYADTRLAFQQHVDRIPLHKAGIRALAGKLREKATDQGGVYVDGRLWRNEICVVKTRKKLIFNNFIKWVFYYYYYLTLIQLKAIQKF